MTAFSISPGAVMNWVLEPYFLCCDSADSRGSLECMRVFANLLNLPPPLNHTDKFNIWKAGLVAL